MNKEIPKAYNPREVEDEIYKKWEESGFFNPDRLELPEDKKQEEFLRITNLLLIGEIIVKIVIPVVSILYLYVSEFYYLEEFYGRYLLNNLSPNDIDVFLVPLRILLLFPVLPILFAGKLANYYGDLPEPLNLSVFQAKLFYEAVYLIIIILIIVRLFS